MLGHLGTFSTFTWPSPVLPTLGQIRLKEESFRKVREAQRMLTDPQLLHHHCYPCALWF